MLVILTEKIDIVVGISHCGVVVELVSMSAAAKSSSVFQVSRMELAYASSKDELLDIEIRFAWEKCQVCCGKGDCLADCSLEGSWPGACRPF